jgi:signal peptidase II
MIKSNTFNIKNIAVISLIAIFFILDRFLKVLALKTSPKIKILDDFLQFNLTKNFNIAFSLPIYGPILNILIVIIILTLIFYLLYLIKNKYPHTITLSILALILGASSNAYDRLFYGYVIDYFNFFNFTILNISDILITGGTIILITINFKSYGFRN